MRLPPPGSDPAQIATFVDSLVRESGQDPRRIAWACQADRGFELWLGNHYTTPTPANKIRLVMNRICNCIVSMVAIQAGDPPKVTFTARESGDRPITYLNTELPESEGVSQQLIAAGLKTPTGQTWTPEQPLPDQITAELESEVERSEIIRAQLAMVNRPPPVGLLPKDILVEVSDQTSAAAIQTIFDAGWEESNAQYTFVENVTNKNIFGWQPTLYEFNDDEKKHVLTNVHPKLVFPDPIHPQPSTWSYVVYDQPISAEEAKEKWPKLSQQIDDAAKQGKLVWIGNANLSEATGTYEQTFERDMVVVRTAWVRCQPYPMTPDQAVAKGKLDRREIPTGPAQFRSANTMGIACEDCGQVYQQSVLTPDDSCPTCGAPLGQTPTRTAHFAPGGTAELTPTTTTDDGKVGRNPAWPTRIGIRKITIIGNSTAGVIGDAESELSKLQVTANRNMPIPFSPYGDGEPKRLEGIQMAINRVLSSMVTHQAYNAYPPEIVSSKLVEKLDEGLKKMRTQPDQRLIIPHELLNQLGGDIKKIIGTLVVPALPADFWKLLDLLLQLIDREGNQAEVIQGNASAGWSGETVKSLQNAASQVIRGKSMFTEFYLKDIAQLMYDSIVHRMGPQDWKRYLGAKPIQAIEALNTRSKSLFVDIGIAIKSGSGAAKDQQTQNMVTAKQAGLPISDPTMMEALGLDPDAELNRQAEWRRKLQRLAGGVPASDNNTAPGNVPGPTQQSAAA